MRPLRLLLVERFDTRFRFNISLNRKGAVAVLVPEGVAASSLKKCKQKIIDKSKQKIVDKKK